MGDGAASGIRMDGRATSTDIQETELKPRCAAFHSAHGRPVGLAVVVVGDRKDSATYVRMKQKACADVGIHSEKYQIDVPSEALEYGESTPNVAQEQVIDTLMKTIQDLNARSDIDGIIVQLPLPSFCDEAKALKSVDPSKDVDGLHPDSHAALFHFATTKATSGKSDALERELPTFSVPCTPAGCLALLDHYNISLEGKNVVVLGRSKIVGLPVSLLCLQKNATVTMCHSRTADLEAKVKAADVVIAAMGKPQFVKKEWIQPGAAVVDVGINPIEDSTKKNGYRLVGDVDYEGVKSVAGAASPVPGGIGPMTVVMLLRNTVDSAYRRLQQPSLA